jgi:5'-nucleotidase
VSIEGLDSLANQVIGVAAGAIARHQDSAGECALGDVVADAVQVGSVTWGENAASIISMDELHADLVAHTRRDQQGPVEITYGMAYAAVPLAQGVTTVTLTGSALIAALQQQFTRRDGGHPFLQVSAELRYSWSPARPAGSMVDPGSVTISGAVVDADATYRITVGNLLLSERGGIPALASATPITAGRYGHGGAAAGQELDLLAAYLSTRKPLSVPPLDRITRTTS